MRSLVYLAGPITGLSYGDTTDWREKVRRALLPDIESLSPMRDKDHLKGEKELGFGYDDALSTDEAIFARGICDIRRADLLLVNLLGAKRVSTGTVFEMGVAYERGIPRFVVMEPSGNFHEHAFIRQAASVRYSSLPEAVAAVRSFLTAG